MEEWLRVTFSKVRLGVEQLKIFVVDFIIGSCYPFKMGCHTIYFRSRSRIFIELWIFYENRFLITFDFSTSTSKIHISTTVWDIELRLGLIDRIFLPLSRIYFTPAQTLHFSKNSAKFKMLSNKNISYVHFKAINKIFRCMGLKILFYVQMQNSIANKMSLFPIDFELACVNGGQMTKITSKICLLHCIKMWFTLSNKYLVRLRAKQCMQPSFILSKPKENTKKI